MASQRNPLNVGIDLPHVVDLRESLANEVQNDGFDFVAVPLVHPAFTRDPRTDATKYTSYLPLTRSDTILQSHEWRYVLGKCSDWILPDSPDQRTRDNARAILKQEVSWACHLNLSAVLLPFPKTLSFPNYASIVCSLVLQTQYTSLWLHVPLVHHIDLMKRYQDEASENGSMNGNPDHTSDAIDTWEIWNKFRMLCHHHCKLSVAIELTEDLPTTAELDRWLAEPIKLITIPSRIFQTGRRGQPSLSQAHVSFLRKLFKYRVQYLLTGMPQHGHSMAAYQFYLVNLHTESPALTATESYEAPYYDYLQAPLQPLMDNLESSTYETFERDSPKYKMYEEAIYKAIVDKVEQYGEVYIPVVMVVGAGRGPIVEAAMRAESRSGKAIRLYALDKNPHAMVCLRNKQQLSDRWSRVVLVHSDMRDWTPTEQCDILVSEMLGSFGDNELSPECLQPAEKFIKPDGLSIPQWYTSYLAPMAATKIYNELVTGGTTAGFETPHVCKFHCAKVTSEPQQCFTFSHPSPQPIDNTRFKSFEFTTEVNMLIHGFAGYFDCCLYKDVHVSILPRNHTPEMSSWFPIYFPIRDPYYWKAGTTLKATFWRHATKQKVWYEWCITDPNQTAIHNPNGRSYFIGLY